MDYINIYCGKVAIIVLETLKTTRPGHHLPPIKLKTFKDIELFLVAHLQRHHLETLVQKNYYGALYSHISQSQQQLFPGIV